MSQRPTLETKRLILRPFYLSDAAEVQRLAGDSAIANTTLNIPHPYEDGLAENWISTHQEIYEQGKGVFFAITLKPAGTLVGAIGLMDMTRGQQAELGYWIGKPYWNKGFCTEAGHAVIQFGFQELNLIRINSRHLSRNPASGRVIQKLGMSHEGRQRKYVKKWDKFEDFELYGILKQDWEKAVNS
ncbi:GNAT family N-acetyltransferase [candidate division WOR-3 bacterium]|nr:GNAT family N-acetyltransferase [candidate division WOR-3 bacterium]